MDFPFNLNYQEQLMNCKKVVLLCFFLTAAVFVFAGGGKDASGSGKTTIYVSAWDVGTSEDVSVYLKLKSEFEKLNPNIVIEYLDTPSTDYNQKLTVMLNGGSDVDVVWIKDGDTAPAYAQRGQLADLGPYLARDNIDRSLFSGISDLTMNGKLIGLPVSSGYYLMFYNKDIFDMMGVPYPDNNMTWTEWEVLCARLSSGSGSNKIYGGFLHTWNACVQNWAVQDGKNTIVADDYSFFKPYYEMALRLQKEGYIWDFGALRAGGISYGNAFLQGNVATLPMGSWFMRTIINAKNEGSAKVQNWGIATLPHPQGVPAGYTVGSMTPVAMNQASKRKDAAWEYIKFITGPQGAAINVDMGSIPARQTPETLKAIASWPGMPEGSAAALEVKNIVLDRPYMAISQQINQMLGEEHSLIMLGETSIDQGLANMARRSKEIQGK